MKSCSIADCDKTYYALGHCRPHYKRLKAYGDPMGGLHRMERLEACAIDGCNNAVDSRGWCQKHYKRWKHNGDPMVVQAYQDLTPETFWARVALTADDTRCWEWQGSRDIAGYGSVSQKRKQYKAHRYALYLQDGVMHDELCVMHHCDNPPCVNPKHLKWATIAENNADMHAKGRGANSKRERANVA